MHPLFDYLDAVFEGDFDRMSKHAPIADNEELKKDIEEYRKLKLEMEKTAKEAAALEQLKRPSGMENAVIERAPEYDCVNPHAVFFRVDGKTIYEVFPGTNVSNVYSEEKMKEILSLEKYPGKIMCRDEIEAFLEQEAIRGLKLEGQTIEAICATIIALGYNPDWVREIFREDLCQEAVGR